MKTNIESEVQLQSLLDHAANTIHLTAKQTTLKIALSKKLLEKETVLTKNLLGLLYPLLSSTSRFSKIFVCSWFHYLTQVDPSGFVNTVVPTSVVKILFSMTLEIIYL